MPSLSYLKVTFSVSYPIILLSAIAGCLTYLAIYLAACFVFPSILLFACMLKPFVLSLKHQSIILFNSLFPGIAFLIAVNIICLYGTAYISEFIISAHSSACLLPQVLHILLLQLCGIYIISPHASHI